MVILFQVPELIEALQDSAPTEQQLKLAREKFCIEVKTINTINIGVGADWIVFLATYVVAPSLAVLAMGKKVNEGIEGWSAVGKKLKSMFKSIDVVSIDCDTATYLAIEFINKRIKIESLVKTNETTINLSNLEGAIRGLVGLAKKPDNYYIQIFLVNDKFYYIIGISSRGELSLLRKFKAADYKHVLP
jgi:hypothetical protein